MHLKSKAPSLKKSSHALRDRYTWHLRPPFKDEFDRSHWWMGKRDSDIEPVAALYELARRHPMVGEGWARNITQPGSGSPLPPPSLYWTCLLGLNSWAKLDWTERRNWESCVGILKGLDFRGEDSQCRCIRVFAHWKIIDQRKKLLDGTGKTFDEMSKLVRQDIAKNPPTLAEWEAAIAQRAVEAHREGYVLLAVAPDLAASKVASVLAKKYREHFLFYPPPKPSQRAKWQDWLPLISAFEDAEAMPGGAKSQVFAHYRRALDRIRFT